MAKIKQRNKVKGIRQLDRAAITSQRMKNAYIRTKTQAVQATGDRQESASEYTDSQVQNVTVLESVDFRHSESGENRQF